MTEAGTTGEDGDNPAEGVALRPSHPPTTVMPTLTEALYEVEACREMYAGFALSCERLGDDESARAWWARVDALDVAARVVQSIERLSPGDRKSVSSQIKKLTPDEHKPPKADYPLRRRSAA
jgi:hypothetical protein